MDNPEKLGTWDTEDEEKQSENTTQYVLDTIMHKQTQIMKLKIRHESSYKQVEVKANRTLFFVVAEIIKDITTQMLFNTTQFSVTVLIEPSS